MAFRQKVIGALWTRWSSALWAATGLGLLAIHGVLLAISPRFAYGKLPVLERPTTLLVVLLMIAGVTYLAAVGLLRLAPPTTRAWWLWFLMLGLAMRALMFPSTPMLETDYFRYLWDGGVVAHGFDPYTHTPEAVLAGDAPRELLELGESSTPVLERVNHPWLTTIYPPVAQAGFAAAHHLAPWRILGLRGVWLACDLLTLALLVALLQRLALPSSAILIYWWNPLLIKEGYNTAHMEMLLLPLLVAALYLAVRHRLLASAIALGLGVGAKLWPVVMLPTLLRRHDVHWKKAAVATAVCTLLGAALVAPMLLAHPGETAGVRAYAASWQMNDALYRAFQWVAARLAPAQADGVARVMVAAVLLAWIVWLVRRPARDGREVCERALWSVAALFLLSPTQYPWYWLWLLPMLVVRPSPGLLVLTVTLPMYYLRFPLRELGYTAWFQNGVVWMQFIPAYLLLAWEAWRSRRPTTSTPTPVVAGNVR